MCTLCSAASVLSDSLRSHGLYVACQAPLSMRISEQDYWSALLLLSPRELPEPGIDPMSPASPVLQADSLPLSHLGSPTKYNDTALIQFSLVHERTQDYNI